MDTLESAFEINQASIGSGPPSGTDGAPATTCYRFHFTGSGKEYFKIWIVNLFLTIVSIGIYSAWAKVRRLQYFDRNTQLAGAVFDFDGDPRAILRGRILALGLLGAYQYAFGFSLTAGILTALALLAALPLAMRSALRFRLRNTRYRGMRFGFLGAATTAYMTYLPPLLMFLLPAVLLALDPSGKTVGFIAILYLLWPLMHGFMKRYQHANMAFGSLNAVYAVSPLRFYVPYLKSIGMFLIGMISAFIIMAVVGVAVSASGMAIPKPYIFLATVASGVLMAYITYLIAGPYLQVRIGNMVWSATSVPGMTISSHLKAREYMSLQLVNTLLTLVTLGLYRPFAVVRAYQYRMDHITITTTSDFEHTFMASRARAGSASADGVADFLGLDLSW